MRVVRLQDIHGRHRSRSRVDEKGDEKFMFVSHRLCLSPLDSIVELGVERSSMANAQENGPRLFVETSLCCGVETMRRNCVI